MTSQRWWRLAVIATVLYFIYDLGPLDLPDVSADAHRIIVGVLSVALAISGSVELQKRRTARNRCLEDVPTQPLRPIGRVIVEYRPAVGALEEAFNRVLMEERDRAWVDGLARRQLRDGERRRKLPFVVD